MPFDDLFGPDDFNIDPDDLVGSNNDVSGWDTGIQPDIFATGETQDIFNTKD